MGITTPHPDNLTVGAGSFLFDRFTTAGARTGLRHVGNAESIEMTPQVERIEKRSSMSGARGILKQITTNRGLQIAIQMDEWDSKNVALALLGIEGAMVQAADASVTDEPINGGVALELDTWYLLTVETTHELGVLNPTVSAIKQGMSTLAAEKYELDLETGMVRLLSAGGAVAGVTTWSGSVPAIVEADGHRIIQGLESPTIQGHGRYISASDQLSGPRYLYDFWKLEISADAALQLISAEFGSFTINATVLEDPTKPVGQRFFRAIQLAAEEES
jgi:hypothetical protein